MKIINTVAIAHKGKPIGVSFKRIDDEVTAHVYSGYNGSMIKSYGYKKMTADDLRNIPEDAYDDAVFWRAALAIFGIFPDYE